MKYSYQNHFCLFSYSRLKVFAQSISGLRLISSMRLDSNDFQSVKHGHFCIQSLKLFLVLPSLERNSEGLEMNTESHDVEVS